VLAVHPSLPARTVQELVALARARPDQLLYSSGGHGVNSHLATALFAHLAKIRLHHVPYKGSTPGVVALLGGEVALMTNSLSTLLGHINAGRLRALGVGSLRRSVAAPRIPTIDEAGLKGYEASQWSALFAPAGTPRDIIARIHAETVAVVRDTETTRRLVEGGSDVVAGSPEELAAFFQAELAKWPGVVKSAGLTPQD
jgi:tripartite-type tricarboxylate transporter receptor subunit TctC